MEARLQSDPAARQVIEEIRATARQLEAALAADPAAPVAAERERVVASPGPKVIHLPYSRRRRGWAQLLGFPQSYFLVSGAAAAVFIGFVMLQSPQFDPPDRVARQLAAEQRARAIAEARYDALRSQLEALEQSQALGDAPAAEPKATFRAPPPSPRVVFVMPPSLPLPKPEPIIGDFRHLAAGGMGWAGYGEVPARAMVDSLSDSGNEESGDDLIRMDPYLVSADEDYFALSYLAYPMTIANVLDWARSGIASAADDPGGFRREYFNIIRRSRGMLQ